MSEPFAAPAALQRIADALGQTDPLSVVEQLAPHTADSARAWARQLPLWDDFQNAFPRQVIALARVISRRAMKDFRLEFAADGRVVEQPRNNHAVERPPTRFPLRLSDATIEVQYTRHYNPNASQDLSRERRDSRPKRQQDLFG